MNAAALHQAAQCALLGKLLRCADAQAVFAVHQPEAVGRLKRQFQVVGGKEDGLSRLAADAAQQQHGLHLAGEVEKGGWLVKDNDGSLLCQCLGYHYLLPLAIAEGVNHAPAQRLDAHLADGLADHVAVVGCQRAEEARVGRAA